MAVIPRWLRYSCLALSFAIAPVAQAELKENPKTLVDEVWQIINSQYVDSQFNQTDWLAVREDLLAREYDDNGEAYAAIRAALKELGDPYTRFLTPAQYEDLTTKTSGELTGVGIRYRQDEATSQLRVLETLTGSPADTAGVRAGDSITRINGKPTALMTLEEVSSEFEGEEGSVVKLQISRSGNVFDVSLTRAFIEVVSVQYELKQAGAFPIGYIHVDEFSSHAAEQMQAALKELTTEGAEGLVLDLRGNPGGLLFSSVDIARMFLKQGNIVRTVDRENPEDRRYWANNTAITQLPLVVLVDQRSASASEILAGALQENSRAKVVGSRTFGKGTVQSVHDLVDGSGLTVTIARYYPPSGKDINKRGIAPDVTVNLSTRQQRRLSQNPELRATVDDPQFVRALQVLQVSRLSEPAEQATQH
ncbi:MAG: S41 family peptidase [Cyanobacteria bacterium P01_H01_bin.15]